MNYASDNDEFYALLADSKDNKAIEATVGNTLIYASRDCKLR